MEDLAVLSQGKQINANPVIYPVKYTSTNYVLGDAIDPLEVFGKLPPCDHIQQHPIHPIQKLKIRFN